MPAKRRIGGWENKAVHGKAIYVSMEDGVAATSFMVKRQAGGMDGLDNLRFCFNCEDVPAYLHNELGRERADLIIIDCWRDVYGKSLKDGAVVRKALSEYAAIADLYNCSIGIVHHSHQRAEKLAPGENNIIKGQDYECKMGLIIELRADDTDPALRHLCIVKGNYLSNDHKERSYVLQFDGERFTYSNSGERVAFGQLKPGVAKGTLIYWQTSFADINDRVHRELVKRVFGRRRLQYTKAYQGLSDAYARELAQPFGRDKSKKLLSYLVQQEFIKKSGVAGASVYEGNRYE